MLFLDACFFVFVFLRPIFELFAVIAYQICSISSISILVILPLDLLDLLSLLSYLCVGHCQCTNVPCVSDSIVRLHCKRRSTLVAKTTTV